jgi:hypothetical protein
LKVSKVFDDFSEVKSSHGKGLLRGIAVAGVGDSIYRLLLVLAISSVARPLAQPDLTSITSLKG